MQANADAAGVWASNRFGLGQKPDDAPPADAQRWLLTQLKPAGKPDHAQPDALPDSAALTEIQLAYEAQQRATDDGAQKMAQRQAFTQQARQVHEQAVRARVDQALRSPQPWLTHWQHFWANHFALSTDSPEMRLLAGAFEREAIAPHVLGRFEDMLLAAETHGAMLRYLNAASSVGPNSPAMRKAQKPRGLNENLAREIMELHTLGVRTGYTQADVTELARAMTGWGVPTAPAPNANPNAKGPALGLASVYRPQFHEPGERLVLGRRYADTGASQARSILQDLASAPATAQHISGKIVRHFVADEPPPELVAALTQTWLTSRGDLPSVYRSLVQHPLTWQAAAPKFKTPWEWLVSSARALGWAQWPDKPQPTQWLAQLGQPVWEPKSPAGWDDVAATWAAPDALYKRVELAQLLAARSLALDARTLGTQLLGPLTGASQQAVARAESPAQALALLLVSPEFLRR